MLEHALEQRGHARFRARQVFEWIYRRGATCVDGMTNLPRQLRELLASEFTLATPAVTWPTPAGIVYGTPLGAAQLDATAAVPGTFAYAPAAGAFLDAGAEAPTLLFTPDDGPVTMNSARLAGGISMSCCVMMVP